MKLLRALLVFAAVLTATGSLPLAAQQAIQHESEVEDATFPMLQLPPQLLNFPDPEFARTAVRIQLGVARMQERRWFYRAAERYAPFTAVPPADWKMKADKAAKKISATGPIYTWSSIGPNGDYDVTRQWGPTGALTQGRATAVWTHMDGPRVVNKNVIFLGTADGGVWKTVDAGQNWVALTDTQPSLAVGAIDVVPGADRVNYSDAIVYVATGEGNFSQPDKDGVGVLKSTDGGKTWVVQPVPYQTDVIGVPGSHRARRIRVDTTIPGAQSVWMAGDGGMYHTADGGTTWKLVTGLPYAGAPATAAYPGGCWVEFATDINIGPTNATTGKATLFATFGRMRDATCVAPAADARKNNGVYRSVDGGATWTKISTGAGFPATPGNVGRMHTFLAPSNPRHMYVVIARADDYKSLGIFSTLDATATPVQWIAGSTDEFTNGQGWYNLTGAVDPTNENRIMVGGLDNYLSVDGGATLTQVSGWSAGDETWAHADHHHAIWVDANTYYDANDGGLNIGHIDGSNTVTWTHANVGALSTLQFYGIGQSATSPYRINAGLQDNGHAYLDGSKWVATYGGDGGYAAVDQDDDNHAYEEYVYGAIRKSDDGGDTWPTTGCMQTFGACTGCLGQCVPDLHTAFIANFSLDANNQNVMYVGTNVLYRNSSARTAGKVWERLAPLEGSIDFVKGSTASNHYVSIVHSAKAGGTTDSLTSKVSKVLYLGTSTGRIWKSSDGGLNWIDLTKAPLPVLTTTAGRYLTWIDTDPTNANNVIITYSGWNLSTPNAPGHVFRSTDGGLTWTDISGLLPDEPFNAIAVNPNTGENGEVYVASDTGVYVNTSAWTGNSWLRINSGLLPHVSVNMLQFTNATSPKRLRAATHGRGIWEMEKGTRASITLDKASYGCSDVVKVTVQDANRGAGSVNVTIASTAEGEETLTLQETPANSGHFAGTITLTGAASTPGDGKLRVFNADNITARYKRKSQGPPSVNTFTTSATSDCDACSGSAGTGANLRFNASSVAQSLSGGDRDEALDNCETGRVDFSVKNSGSGALTNVRIVRVVASNPGVVVGTYPSTIASTLAACSTAASNVRVVAGGLTPGEDLTLRIDVTSDELIAQGVTRSLNVTFKDTERDYVFRASKTYSFETGLEGWQRVSGTFKQQTTGGGANLTNTYIASNTLVDGTCDNIRSPKVKLGATSALTMYNQFVIEPMNDAWYDRANLGLYDVSTGVRTVVNPSFGRTYLADGPNGVCITAGKPGWGGPGPGWLPSQFSSADLGAASRAGKVLQLDIGYGTDPLASGTGFWFDEVTLTNFYEQVADTQSNGCP
jgi:hypothetical protein